MMILSKPVHSPRDVSDGIRICVMRKIKDDFDIDIWLPCLAPSKRLLERYNAGEIGWDDYVPLFQEEVLDNEEKMPFFKMLLSLADDNVISLLCHEETDGHCHRRLLIEKLDEIKALNAED